MSRITSFVSIMHACKLESSQLVCATLTWTLMLSSPHQMFHHWHQQKQTCYGIVDEGSVIRDGGASQVRCLHEEGVERDARSREKCRKWMGQRQKLKLMVYSFPEVACSLLEHLVRLCNTRTDGDHAYRKYAVTKPAEKLRGAFNFRLCAGSSAHS
jgi:hypothetical protein